MYKVWKVLWEFWCFHQKTTVPIRFSWNDWKAIVFASKAWVIPFKNTFILWKINMLWEKRRYWGNVHTPLLQGGKKKRGSLIHLKARLFHDLYGIHSFWIQTCCLWSNSYFCFGNQYAEITLSLLMTFYIFCVSYVYHMHCSNLALFSSSWA